MLIKICGITTLEAAIAAERAGADFIGFVFAKSKRQISIALATKIARHVNIPIVGVFVNESVETMNKIAREVPLAYIQLHGEETIATAQKLNFPVIKAFAHDAITPNFPAAYTLIDNTTPGAGIAYSYEKVILPPRCFLAGGISLTNVDQVLRCQPAGIDVSSGVETNGQKDPEKIQQLIAYVRSQTNV